MTELTTPQRFAGWIKARRMSRIDVAVNLGVSADQITRYTNGTVKPSTSARLLIENMTSGEIKAGDW